MGTILRLVKEINTVQPSRIKNLLYHSVILQTSSRSFIFPFISLPNAEGNLQQSANTRDEEDGTDEVALCEAIMLQTQPLRQD